MFTDVGSMKLITVAVVTMLLFGPDKLPEIVRNITKFIRAMREISERAEQEIRSELGPEYKDFKFENLHPKAFVRRNLLDDGPRLDEIYSALDPRGEFTQVAGAMSASADVTPAGAVSTGRVTRAPDEGRAAGISGQSESYPDIT
ncbi:Sec-independent protein translocase subunit TatB [Streptomyces sp. NPDC048362]|uniref:Sec-independent protein translocase subunit TatB n=1 Tax=Streptomyces sp. NPDC048362 TaxID=3365539 RepID=UPI003712F5F5